MLKRILKFKVEQPDGTKVSVCIRPTSYEVEQKLKILYARTYKNLVGDGVATKSAMLDLVKKEGLWTEKDEERLNELVIQLSVLETLLENTTDVAEQRSVVVKLVKLRNELLELVQVKSEPMEFTAETIAEDFKMENYLVESTFFEETGARYFKDYNDFKMRRYDKDIEKIYTTFIQAVNVVSTKTLMNLPENKWLQTQGKMDKKGIITDDDIWKELESDGAKLKEDTNTEKTVEEVVNKIEPTN